MFYVKKLYKKAVSPIVILVVQYGGYMRSICQALSTGQRMHYSICFSKQDREGVTEWWSENSLNNISSFPELKKRTNPSESLLYVLRK